ncbi:MAG: carboxypeptidase regulatory-like domain-containing protein [Candidatus Nanohaloarchaea archaeon]
MKNKILIIAMLVLAVFASPVVAQDQIEVTEFDMPEQAEQGEEITVTIRSKVDDKEVEIMGLNWGEGIQEKSCGEPVYCEREWNFSIDNEGYRSVTATAEDEDGLETSRTEFIDITEEDDVGSRVTSMTFSELPDPAKLGETYTVNAEAYDSRGNLWSRNLDIYYEYYKNGFKQEEIGSSDCYWNPRLGTERERCSAEGEFEPVEGATANKIVAEIEASDGKLISREESFNVEEAESDFVINDVSIKDEEIEEGQSTTFEAEIENEGSADGYSDINWYADDIKVGSKYVNIDAGDSRTVTLNRDYSELQESGLEIGKQYDVSAEEEVSGDERNSGQTVTLLEEDEPEDPANFDVEIDRAESVTEGETLEVDFTVTNTGDKRDSQYVELDARNERRDREYVSYLEPGESESGTLEWDTEEGDSGYRNIKISSENDEATKFVNIKGSDQSNDPANFDVEIDDFDDKVTEGESVYVDYTVTNTGDQEDSQDIDLRARGQRQDRDSNIDLEPGESESGKLEWDTEDGDSGYRSIKVQSENDDATEIVEVLKDEDEPEEPEEDSEFRITNIDSNSPVDEEETALVDYEVENRGGKDSQYVELYVRGERRDRDWVSLDSDESETGTLKWQTEDGDSGYRRADVETENDEDFTYINVRESDESVEDADVEFKSVSTSRYSVGPGESTELRSTVENEGGSSASVQVDWRAGGNRIGSDSRTVPGDSQRDLERDRSYNQLLSEGLEAGECYSLSARLRSGGDLADSRSAPQNLCLEEEDEPEDTEEEFDLDVVVLSSSGSSLENAEVNVGGETAFTRSNGVATIENLEEGSYDVVASKPGYSTRVRNNVELDRDRTISLTLSEVDGVEADFSFSPERPLEDQTVQFNGGLSSGDIESYDWEFDDGSTASGRTVTHEFDDSGFYRVNLEVEDSQGRTDDRTRVVHVRSEEADPEFYNLDVDVVDSETDDEIEDARVSVDGRTRTTDSDGEAGFNLEESVYSVFVSADDYRSESRTVTLDRDRNIEVELDSRDRDIGQGEIRIQDIRMPNSVCRGEDVTARLDIENTGDRDRTFTLSASGLENEIDRSYSLDDDESFTRTIEFINVEGSGNERVSFTTGDGSREKTVQVRDCGDQDDSDISVSARPTQIRVGESVRVSGYVDDVDRGTQVNIGSSNSYRSLGSATTDPSGYYELYVEPSSIGEQTLTAEASGMEANTRVDVLPTVSVVSASSSPDRVFEGDTYEVCAEVESQSSGPLVVLKEDGEEVDSKYGRGEVCFDRRTKPGNYDYEVVGYARGQSSTKSTSVEVMEMDSEVRNFPDQIASVRSGSGMVRVQLYNNQREFRNYEISLEGLPDSWTAQSRKQVHLDSGERKTEYLYFTPKEEGEFTGTLRVESEDGTVYTEDIDLSSGGTDREPSRLDRFMMWLRYR